MGRDEKSTVSNFEFAGKCNAKIRYISHCYYLLDTLENNCAKFRFIKKTYYEGKHTSLLKIE